MSNEKPKTINAAPISPTHSTPGPGPVNANEPEDAEVAVDVDV
ncbi:MAG: hypothetical protein ABSC30_02955 [Acidimicrobiales bacterium]